MNKTCKCIVCLLSFCLCLSTLHSQNNKWILGEWKGTVITPGSAYSTVFTGILTIYAEHKNHFVGKLVKEVTGNKDIRIEKNISGILIRDEMNIETGRTIFVKQPVHGFWADCSNCQMVNSRIIVTKDSIVLTYVTTHCDRYCDGIAKYAKPLSDLDTSTQRKLVSLFGTADIIADFHPTLPLHKNEVAKLQNQTETKMIDANDREAEQAQLNRKTKTIATYDVYSTDIKIELFDNGEIDGDTITVYHNKTKIVDRQGLGIKPIVCTVKASSKERVHEFILVANNLGTIPPNTALMRITAGSKTYELFASTTLDDNASIIIIYGGE
jgi:hypothetical protein